MNESLDVFKNIKEGQTINLEFGKTYDFSNQKGYKLPNGVTINGNSAKIKCHYDTDFSRQPFYFDDGSHNIAFKNCRFDLKNHNVLVLQGRNFLFQDCSIVKGSNGIGIGRGIAGLMIQNLKDEGEFSGNAFGFFGSGASRPNSNITILNSNIKYGSTGEHVYRFHFVDGVHVEGGTLNCFDGKHALNIRDGRNITIKKVVVNAPTVIGPLELEGEEDKKLDDVLFDSCELNGWNAIYSGVTNLRVINCKGIAEKGSYCWSVRKPFGNRKQAEGIIKDSSFIYKGKGELVAGNKAETVKFINVKFEKR